MTELAGIVQVAMVDERFGVELILVLNGREMRHHPAEHLIAVRLIGRRIAVGDLLAILLDPQFLRHQPEQQIDVEPLPEQEQ